MRLVQFLDKDGKRSVARVRPDGDQLEVLTDTARVYDLALDAAGRGSILEDLVEARSDGQLVDYDAVIADRRILPPLDHPDPARCLVTGTGLTGFMKSQVVWLLNMCQGRALLSLLLFYLVINSGLALIYAFFLTHPGCYESPEPIPGVNDPEQIWFTTSDGIKIRSWYYRPQNGVVIITFGGQRGALGQNLPPAASLIHAGYGVLQMDSRSCAKPPSVVTLGGDEIHDVNAAVAYLKSQPEVDHIGAFGFSMGAATVIRASAYNAEIEAVVAEGGFYNLGDDIVEPEQKKSLPLKIFLYTLAGSYRLFSGVDPWQVSPIEDLPRLSPRPIFLIYGEHEAASGRAYAQYTSANQPKSIWIVPEGRHGTNHQLAPALYEQKLLQFFYQSLR